jgi:hypothetical protein
MAMLERVFIQCNTVMINYVVEVKLNRSVKFYFLKEAAATLLEAL